ncbi:MAG TPA: trypsin-like serine protease [Verrucomicrobiales bacterium]|nr:trypsin-like serine protease [Verrucomicrobiales bacterium]
MLLRALFRFLTVPLTAGCFASSALAVVVAGTTGNTTAPVDNPGWLNVGSCNSASAVYLGNRWVLTAYHVNAGGGFPVVFNGTVYTPVPGTNTQLTNNGTPGMSANTDLMVFQINADPGLPPVQLSSTAAVLGDDLLMIGNGLNRQASRTFWQVAMNAGANNDTWTETTGAHNVEGFKADTGAAQRWGTNDAEFVGLNINDGVGDVRSFVSLFDDDVGRPNEAQGILGDSGGGVFHKVGAQWQLSGIMVAVGTGGNPGFFDNPPADTAAFGQHVTIMADLSFYRNQILALTVPEPSTALLFGMAAPFTLRRSRSRKGCSPRR